MPNKPPGSFPMLPKRIPKPAKRATRWRKPSYRAYIRTFACCVCGSTVNVECAHVRIGSGAGLSQKPDDWRCVPLCGGMGCHNRQHSVGEETFWAEYAKHHGQTVEQLIEELNAASPAAAEIRALKREREVA